MTAIAKEIKYTENEIRYYSKIFSPWCKKVMGLRLKLFKLKRLKNKQKKITCLVKKLQEV